MNSFTKITFPIITLTLTVFCTAALKADDVFLKNGRRYLNIKAVPHQNRYILVLENGRTLALDRAEVQKTRIKRVLWTRQLRPEALDKLVRARINLLKAESRKKKLQQKQAQKRKQQRRTKLNAPLYSSLLPGTGQLATGNRIRGILFMGGTLALGALYLDFTQKYNRADGSYKQALQLGNLALLNPQSLYLFSLQAKIITDHSRIQIQQNGNRANLTALIFSALYIYNIFDAWSIRKSALQLEPKIGLEKHNRFLELSLRLRF